MHVLETSYDGYRFRSRLEARWAVFFNTLGFEYQYEKEGFDLDDRGWYLPDFWLPRFECWIEIKGEEPTQQEIAKCQALMDFTGKDAYLFVGSIPPNPSNVIYPWCEPPARGNAWVECLGCNTIWLGLVGLRRCSVVCQRQRLSLTSPRLMAAYRAARSHRFEGR